MSLQPVGQPFQADNQHRLAHATRHHHADSVRQLVRNRQITGLLYAIVRGWTENRSMFCNKAQKRYFELRFTSRIRIFRNESGIEWSWKPIQPP